MLILLIELGMRGYLDLRDGKNVMILRVYPHITKKRIVGHCDVSPGRKIDPGQYFDWQRYLQNI